MAHSGRVLVVNLLCALQIFCGTTITRRCICDGLREIVRYHAHIHTRTTVIRQAITLRDRILIFNVLSEPKFVDKVKRSICRLDQVKKRCVRWGRDEGSRFERVHGVHLCVDGIFECNLASSQTT